MMRAVGASIRTLLFSDVEGSTALLDRMADGYAALIERHRAIIRTAIGAHGGIEHGTEGDSFFVSFDSPTAALGFAVRAQLDLVAEPWPDGNAVRVRMGVHVGEVDQHDWGLVGLAVHHAARVAASAHGGQVVVTDDVRRMTPTLRPGVTLYPLGAHRLRDLGIVSLYQVQHADLPVAFPPLRAMPVTRTNLPRVTSPLIGHAHTMDELVEAIRTNPLHTLTGTGGVGKTRVATELGRLLMNDLGGAWLVELAPVADPESVLAAVCVTLSVVPQPGMTLLESMVDHLRERTMLLILDNCEHVIAAVIALVSTVLEHCPDVTVLATSREALALAGERVHPVASLLPVNAVELFVARVSAADPTVEIGPAELIVIAEICQRLDGIPLAIELAAARARSLSLSDLLDRLGDRFRLLRGGARGALDRHHTLQATVSWSYQLLTPDEQLLFERVSVFSGGFDLHAAEEVCAGPDLELDRLDVVDLLSGLVDKSMVVADLTGTATRYRLLETLRQFGEDRLDQRGELAELRDRHLVWCVGVVEAADVLIRTSRQLDGDGVFDREWDNLRDAVGWALAGDDLRAAERLVDASYRHAFARLRIEHVDWLDRIMAAEGDEVRLSTITFGLAAGWDGHVLGADERGCRLARVGIERASRPDHGATALCWSQLGGASPLWLPGSAQDEWAFAGLLAAVANLADPDADWWALVEVVDHCFNVHFDQVGPHLERLREVAQRVRAPLLLRYVEMFQGSVRLLGENLDYEGALQCYLSALDSARLDSDAHSVGAALRAVAMASCALGDNASLVRAMEAFDFLYAMRYWQKGYQSLESVANALALAGHLDDAAVVVGFLDREIPTGYGMERGLGFRETTRRMIGAGRTALFDRGAAMKRDQLAAFVLRESAGHQAR